MYYLTFGLLLTIFAVAVTCQSCESARRALASNQDCLDALRDVGGAVQANRTISLLELNLFCQPSCRNLVNAVLTCDNDPNGEERVKQNQFLCTTDHGTSCYDFLVSARFNQLVAAAGACVEDIRRLDGQMCSSTCQTVFQNFVVDGGCCTVEVLKTQLSNSSLMELLEECPIDLSRGGTCVEIGGAHGFKAFVSVLLLAVALALVSF